MTDANAKKKYAHLKGLIAGKLKTGNPVRDDLIVSDATLNLANLIKKRPNIQFEEEPIAKTLGDEEEEVKQVEEVKETKSKRKK